MTRAAGLILLLLAVSVVARAAPAEQRDAIRIELNAVELNQGHCRVSFVVENKGEGGVESLKLDLAVFGRDGVIHRRLVVELGPLRGIKTVVKSFELDGECGQIGSVLVNDVTACVPGSPDSCIDRLVLASRLPNVRLFK